MKKRRNNNREKNQLTEEQKRKIKSELILLTVEDVKEITGWGEQTVRDLFARDEEFPAVKKGKRYLVSLDALKEYFNKRHVSEQE